MQEGAAIAKKVGVQFGLLEGLAVHEHQTAVGFIKELLVLLIQADPLHLVFRTEAFVQLAPVAEVFQLHLREGAALAGLHMVDLHGGPKPAIMFQHVAGTNFVAVDLGHPKAPWLRLKGNFRLLYMPGRSVASLLDAVTPFRPPCTRRMADMRFGTYRIERK